MRNENLKRVQREGLMDVEDKRVYLVFFGIERVFLGRGDLTCQIGYSGDMTPLRGSPLSPCQSCT